MKFRDSSLNECTCIPIMSGGLTAVKKACLTRMHTVRYYYTLFRWPSDIPVGKHPNDYNIESNHQVRHCGEAYILLIVTLKWTILLFVRF